MALFETTFGPYVPFGSRNLSLATPAARGSDVAIVQAVYNLMRTVMDAGPAGVAIPLTGIYDTATATAVRGIQAYFGLGVDGIVGPATYFVFGQGVGEHTTYDGPRFGSRDLAVGATGGDVVVLQNRLSLFAPYARQLGGPADAVFGQKTAAAVRAFKADAVANGDSGLDPDGVVGFGACDALWLYTGAGGRGLLRTSGRNGFDVAFVQAVLRELGAYTGPVNGMYDALTQTAVMAFQRAEGITADGSVGPVTFYRLGLRNQQPAPGPFPLAWPASGRAASIAP